MEEIQMPEHLRYDPGHTWVDADSTTATVGITDFAQKSWGDVGFAQVPVEGSSIRAGDAVGMLSSALEGPCDIISPISGRVSEVNPALDDDPTIINSDPYGEGWLYRVKMSDPAELRDLIDAASYRKSLRTVPPQHLDQVLQGIFPHSRDAMIVLDPNRCVLMMNPAAEKLTGYKKDSVAGWARCYHLFRCHAQGIRLHGIDCPPLTADNRGCQSDFTITRRDGTEVPVSATYSSLPDPDGSRTLTLLSLRPKETSAS
jgi:glycine cleavage system H protein